MVGGVEHASLFQLCRKRIASRKQQVLLRCCLSIVSQQQATYFKKVERKQSRENLLNQTKPPACHLPVCTYLVCRTIGCSDMQVLGLPQVRWYDATRLLNCSMFISLSLAQDFCPGPLHPLHGHSRPFHGSLLYRTTVAHCDAALLPTWDAGHAGAQAATGAVV